MAAEATGSHTCSRWWCEHASCDHPNVICFLSLEPFCPLILLSLDDQINYEIFVNDYKSFP